MRKLLTLAGLTALLAIPLRAEILEQVLVKVNGDIITKTELELIDLGSDAVPEVTQTPEESAPPGSEPPGPIR